MANGIYHYSPRTARYLQSIGMCLPSRHTTKQLVGDCLRHSGPCPNVQAALRTLTTSMSLQEKFVSICSDGMKIKPAVRYERHNDCIGGLEDMVVGEFGTRSLQPADEMQAVWIRGIGGRWKQVLGYYFVRGSVGKNRFELRLVPLVMTLQLHVPSRRTSSWQETRT